MDNKKNLGDGSFHVNDHDAELEQSDEEIDVTGLSPLESNVSQIDVARANPVTVEDPILSFSREVVADFISNLVQESDIPLVESLCNNYGYSTFTVDINECLSDSFFQRHALRNNYLLTPAFLARVNELRNVFSDRISVILDSNNFSLFLFKVGSANLLPPYLSTLMDNYSLNFSDSASHARSELVSFLRSTIIPALVEIINQHTVVRGPNECGLSYHDREQLFLHVVTTFERLIMLRLMNYWNGLLSVNQVILSALPDIDYSDPFIIARDRCNFSIPAVSNPVAFTFLHGICISFMAFDYLNKLIEDSLLSIKDILRPIIVDNVNKACDNIFYVGELLEFKSKKLPLMIQKEFLKIVDTCIKNKIVHFLNSSLIWSRAALSDVDLQSFVTSIITNIYGLVEINFIDHCDDVVKAFSDRTNVIRESRKFLREIPKETRASFEGKSSISSKCGFELDDEFCSKLTRIISEDLSLSIPIANKKCDELIESGNISSFDWNDISRNLIPAISDEAEGHTSITNEKINEAISKARIVCDGDVERELSSVEKFIVRMNIEQMSYKKFRSKIKSLWTNTVKNRKLSSTADSSVVSAVDSPSGASVVASSSRDSVVAGPSGASVVASSSRDSVVAGPSGASVVASSSRDSVVAGPSGAYAIPSSSASSAVPSIVEGKSKGKKRKRDDTLGVVSAEHRSGIVHSEYGSILVNREFNDEISSMVLEHISYVSGVFEDIRDNLEEEDSYATHEELVDNILTQSRESGANVLSEFVDRVRDVVSNASVYDNDMKERGIDEDEVSDFMRSLYGVIKLQHDEILFEMINRLIGKK